MREICSELSAVESTEINNMVSNAIPVCISAQLKKDKQLQSLRLSCQTKIHSQHQKFFLLSAKKLWMLWWFDTGPIPGTQEWYPKLGHVTPMQICNRKLTKPHSFPSPTKEKKSISV